MILIVGFITINSFSQSQCSIDDHYQDIFKVKLMKYGDNEFLMKTIATIDSNACYASLINDNKQYLDYILTHFFKSYDYDGIKAIKDTVLRQKEYIKALKSDSSFSSVMSSFSNKSSNSKDFVPDTVSMDELLNIAVKYFYVLKINEKGQYEAKICTGYNGIKETMKTRNPHVEAFCFSTIMNNYQGEKYNMNDEFVKGLRELYKISFGVDKDERLTRAQGAMYMFMRHNDILKELLLFEYENKKEILPFVLEVE